MNNRNQLRQKAKEEKGASNRIRCAGGPTSQSLTSYQADAVTGRVFTRERERERETERANPPFPSGPPPPPPPRPPRRDSTRPRLRSQGHHRHLLRQLPSSSGASRAERSRGGGGGGARTPPTPLPAAMEAYKLWVRRNRDLVRSLESLANVIPRSRFPLGYNHFLLSVGPVKLSPRVAYLVDSGDDACAC